MANRVKEDEKNERAIRSLLKLPENRRCINCNSLGPQYVCTNFWMFVCTTCSGIHREFTHRVKSVSMAKFTSQEVAALQSGGNARAKEILFKEWDPQRHSCPDSNNIERLRDFIRHVYIDRRYSGGRGSEMPPKGQESSENKQTDSIRRGSRSPPYERQYSGRPSPGGRSDDSNSRYGERKSPVSSSVGPEVVNDWHREDRFVNERRDEGRSPDNQKDKGIISPISRPVRDILAGNVIPLRISGPPKADGARAAVGFANTLRTASSSSLGSADRIPVEPKRKTLGSLIDFDADPEPPVKAAVQLPQQTFNVQPTSQAAGESSDANWVSFDLARDVNASHFSSNASNFEYAFSQLSVSAPVHGQLSGPNNFGGTIPPTSVPPPVHGLTGQLPIFPHQPLHTGIHELTSTDQDLFAATYSAPGLGWKYGPPGSIGFNLQYNNTASIPTFPQPAKLTNPFDLDNDPPPFQAPSYPSMSSLQGSLSSHPPALTPQAPRAYMGQQAPSNMPPSWNQGLEGYEHPNQSLPGQPGAPTTPRGSFPSGGGGNPFV